MTITETVTEPCVRFQAIADGLGLEGVENLTLSLSGPPNVQLTNASLHFCIQDSEGKHLSNIHRRMLTKCTYVWIRARLLFNAHFSTPIETKTLEF